MPELDLPPRIDAARLPTPIERLSRLEERHPGHEIWIKRDDLTGSLLSGNKVRKLEFTFARALSHGVDGVITCGGFDSNHCRATTYLAARLGLETHLFLRTPDGRSPRSLRGNTLLDHLAGAEIRWITHEQYASRQELMAEYAREADRDGRRLQVIPEGASDEVGAFGYVKAAEEIETERRARGLEFDHVVHAMGSGGTTAGLLAGREMLEAPWRVTGVPVCDDGDYFRDRVREIRERMLPFGVPEWKKDAGFEVLEGYQGRGYGLTTPAELEQIRELCRLEGILLDPCYTGKAFAGLVGELNAGRLGSRTRVLFLHTGGVFANFTYGEEWNALLGETPRPEGPGR